jgi:hypothetical protein
LSVESNNQAQALAGAAANDVGWNWVAYRKAHRDAFYFAPEVLGVRPAGEVLEGFLMQLELFECHFAKSS